MYLNPQSWPILSLFEVEIMFDRQKKKFALHAALAASASSNICSGVSQ